MVTDGYPERGTGIPQHTSADVGSCPHSFYFEWIAKFCNFCVLWIYRWWHLALIKSVLPKWNSGLKWFLQINHSLTEDNMKNISTSGQQENSRTDSSPIPSTSFPSAPLQVKSTLNKVILIRNQTPAKTQEILRKSLKVWFTSTLLVTKALIPYQ